MKVGQQIQMRMKQLGVSIPELAKRAGVSSQAVRHWVAGRSFPGKRHAPAVESALSFTIDFTEGVAKKTGRQDASSLLKRHDVELMLMIAKLGPDMRLALRQLVEACLNEQTEFSVKERAEPVESFYEKGREDGIKRSKKRAAS